MRKRSRLVIAVVASIVVFSPGIAQADDGRWGGTPVLSEPLVEGLAGPLQLALDGRSTVYIAQSFAGVLTVLDDGGRRDIPAPDIDGIDEDGGRVVFSTRGGGEPGDPGFFATLRQLRRDGSSRQIADLWAYEQRANPDKVNTYGFVSIAPDCAAKWPADFGPPQYPGQPDSNPFGVLAVGNRTYVADAGANALLAVSDGGRVRTVAVLPPQPLRITAQQAQALGLPNCVVGLTYRFEPVPTDVERGPDGMLYVTTLPGGPESPVLGARGSVYKVNPANGSVQRIATGFLGATNLAIWGNGEIFVSELFAGRVSRVGRTGTPRPVVDVVDPSGLEYADGRLYVSYDVFGNGSIATIRYVR